MSKKKNRNCFPYLADDSICTNSKGSVIPYNNWEYFLLKELLLLSKLDILDNNNHEHLYAGSEEHCVQLVEYSCSNMWSSMTQYWVPHDFLFSMYIHWIIEPLIIPAIDILSELQTTNECAFNDSQNKFFVVDIFCKKCVGKTNTYLQNYHSVMFWKLAGKLYWFPSL